MPGVSDARSQVFDAQLHVWEEEPHAAHSTDAATRLANHGGASPTPETVLGLMDATEVSRAVIVPASFLTGHDPAGVDASNDYAIRMAELHEGRFCVVGRVSIPAPGRWADMSDWLSRPHMRGIRVVFTRDAARWLTDGTADWLWPEAERHGIPVMVFAPGLGEELGRVAAAHPDLTLIVDHGNLPTQGAAADLEDHVAKVCELARFPRVMVKASALPIALPEEYPFPASVEVTRRYVDAFGAERVFWGSDFTRARYAYEQGVRYLQESGRFSDDELVWIMGEGLSRALQWPTELHPSIELAHP